MFYLFIFLESEVPPSTMEFKIMNKEISYIKVFVYNVDTKKCEKINVIDTSTFEFVDEEVLKQINVKLRQDKPNISFISNTILRLINI